MVVVIKDMWLLFIWLIPFSNSSIQYVVMNTQKNGILCWVSIGSGTKLKRKKQGNWSIRIPKTVLKKQTLIYLSTILPEYSIHSLYDPRSFSCTVIEWPIFVCCIGYTLRCQFSSWRHTKVLLGRFAPDLSTKNTERKISIDGSVGWDVITDCVWTWKLEKTNTNAVSQIHTTGCNLVLCR